jgi:DNA-binding transcriptional regulator YiaG
MSLLWRIITTPSCWRRRRYPTSAVVSALINDALDRGFLPSPTTRGIIQLGNLRIMDGGFDTLGAMVNVMPDLATAFRLHDALAAPRQPQTIPQLLREARKAHGWSIREASARLGCSDNALRLFEQDKPRNPTLRLLRAFVSVYGISPHDLLNAPDAPAQQPPPSN